MLTSNQITSNILVKHNGTVGRLKPCKMKLKEHGSQGRGGNRENHAEPRSSLKVSSVGELTISIGSLFHEMGILTENDVFLRSRRKEY